MLHCWPPQKYVIICYNILQYVTIYYNVLQYITLRLNLVFYTQFQSCFWSFRSLSWLMQELIGRKLEGWKFPVHLFVEDLRFWQGYYWRFNSFVMWDCLGAENRAVSWCFSATEISASPYSASLYHIRRPAFFTCTFYGN
jgi:hypothetical protein